jgi:hypothetical protein
VPILSQNQSRGGCFTNITLHESAKTPFVLHLPIVPMETEQVMQMLEDAISKDGVDGMDTASAADIMAKVAAGLEGMDLNAPSLATESQFGGDDDLGSESHYGGMDDDHHYDDYDDDGSDLSSSVMLPAHPTPYEVWQEKHEHEMVGAAPKVKVLSGAEMDHVIDRLNSAGKKKQQVLALQQHKQIAEEIKTASFKPEINSKSRKINSENHVQRLPDRQDALLAARDAQLKKQRELKVEKELEEMRDFPDHVSASQSSWERIKRRQNIQVKERERSADHLMRYGEDKKTRMLQRRQIAHDSEDREATFMPQINSNSLRIHQKMMRQGRDVRRDHGARKKRVVVGGKGTAEDPGHEEEVFKPKINTRSRKVPVDGDAFTRLYDKAMVSKKKKDGAQRDIADKHIKGVAGIGSTRKAGMRGAALHSADSVAATPTSSAVLDAVSGVLHSDPSAVLNVSSGTKAAKVHTVDYNDTMHFIFDSFATPWPLQAPYAAAQY